MSRTITVNIFSEKNIQDAIDKLKEYRNGLDAKCRTVAQKLAEKGVEIAKMQVESLDAVFNGDLLASIHSENKGDVFCVVADDQSALFVEFGTGIIGKNSPYTGQLPDGVTWEYATGKTIHRLADGRYGWFYQADNGQWYFTEGMPSRPFMTNTANLLLGDVVEIVREVFSDGH